MNKTVVRLFIVVLVSLLSCNNINESYGNKRLVVDKSIIVTDLFERIEIVPLETNDESIISTVKKVIYYSGRYFIHDGKSESVLVFSESGKYLFCIEQKGRGPEEYNMLQDIEINRFSGNLELLTENSIMVFDINGTYLSRFKIPTTSNGFVHVKDSIYGFYQMHSKKRFKLYSFKEKKVITGSIEVPQSLRLFALDRASPPFYIYNDTAYLCSVISSEVFAINEDGLHLKYITDFDQQNFDPDKIPDDLSPKEIIGLAQDLDMCYNFRTIENDTFRITNFVYKMDNIIIINNKLSGKELTFSKLSNEIGYMGFKSFPGGFYGTVEPSILGRYINDDLTELMNEKSEEVLNNLEIGDNPIILKYYLKI